MQCILEISLKKVKSNWEKINKYSNFKASAVVKANAYGFGLEEIALALSQSGCNFFYVAQIEEGVKLRRCLKSNKINIGVLEGMLYHPDEYKKNNLIPVINNLNQLKNFIKVKKFTPEIKSILHIDTGMNRLGLDKNELERALKDISNISSMDFEYIMTHFSNSNVKDDNFNNVQYEEILRLNAYLNKKISLSNTGGILLDHKFILDQTRPGIGIYGFDANGKNIILNKKALNFPAVLKVPILQIRFGKKGDKVSYGRTETLKRNSKLATIGIGYADGILRLLKKNMNMIVNGKSCKIVGSITMDSLIIDITDVETENIKVGSYLELINEDFLINLSKDKLDVSIYELFTLISNRVIRKYV